MSSPSPSILAQVTVAERRQGPDTDPPRHAVRFADGPMIREALLVDRAEAEVVAALLRDVAGHYERRIGELTPSAEQFPKLSNVSFYGVRDRQGRPRYRVSYRIPGYPRRTDRLGLDGRKGYKWAQAVNEVLESVRARMIKPEEAYRRLCVDRRPLSELIDQYERHLKTQNVNEDYRKSTIHRLKEAMRIGDITRLDHLTKAAVDGLPEQLLKIRVNAKSEKSEKTITRQTVNYYLKAVKQFSRWLAKSSKVAADPLQYVGGIKAGAEGGRRRDASPEDAQALYAAAMADEFSRPGYMRGPDRAMLYLFAWATGLRKSELEACQVSWLKLDGDRPTLNVPAEFTKNKAEASQPLPAWLAAATATWLGKRKAGPLFVDMPQDMTGPFQRDREAAKLEYQTGEGRLVFHSFRHGFASALLDSDAETKLVQSLTRHSTINLLFDRYGHARRDKKHDAVERAIPDPRQQTTGDHDAKRS